MDEVTETEVDPDGDSADGLVTVRGALYGLGLLWLTAIAAVGAVQAIVYGVTTEPIYVLVAIGVAVVALAAGYGSMRAFGFG